MKRLMKRIIVCTVTVTTILISTVSAHALVMATRYKTSLDFSETSAHCDVRVMDSGKAITIMAKLQRGTTLIGSWSDTGISFVDVDETETAQSGQAYTLSASYKINGVTYDLPDITKTCP